MSYKREKFKTTNHPRKCPFCGKTIDLCITLVEGESYKQTPSVRINNCMKLLKKIVNGDFNTYTERDAIIKQARTLIATIEKGKSNG